MATCHALEQRLPHLPLHSGARSDPYSRSCNTIGSHLTFVEGVSHADFEITREHRRIFAVGMPMWRNPVTVWHLQPDREISLSRGRIPF
jgi:hypothetical protein